MPCICLKRVYTATLTLLNAIRRAEIEGMMAIVVKGDAMSVEDLDKAFESIEDVDAVVSTIGGTPADPTSDSQVMLEHRATLHSFWKSGIVPILSCM